MRTALQNKAITNIPNKQLRLTHDDCTGCQIQLQRFIAERLNIDPAGVENFIEQTELVECGCCGGLTLIDRYSGEVLVSASELKGLQAIMKN